MGNTYNGVQIFEDTTFTEVLVASNGCDSVVTTFVSAILSSTKNVAHAIDLTLFPNPADDRFYVQFALEKMENIQLNVFDPIGKNSVFSAKNKAFAAGGHTLEINTEGWSSGVYLVHFQIDDGVATSRVVVR